MIPWRPAFPLALALIVVTSVAALAAPGDRVAGYGTDGEVPIEWITTEVGIAGFLAAPDGRAILNVSPDPDVSSFSIVSADGSEVTTVGLPGPGEAAFGPGSSIIAAYRESDGTTAAKYDASGDLDATFGEDGTIVVPTNGSTFPSALTADGSAIVIAGGTFDAGDPKAWIARLHGDGAPDTSFDDDGVVDVLEDPDADFVIVQNVYPIDDGYLLVILALGLGDDVVTVVSVGDDGTVGTATEFSFTDEVFAVSSTAMVDGSVVVGAQTTADDVDTFHLFRFDETGARDPGFDDPELTIDEVGGRMYLAGLRTGEVALAVNIGSDMSYDVRLFDDSGTSAGDFPISAEDRTDAWIFGAAATWHDGGLLLPTDPVPSSSIEPDEVVIIKYRADESGRFLDDDGIIHEANIERVAAAGLVRGCDPPANVEFCPDRISTRGEAAAMLARALELPATAEDFFVDDEGSVFEGDINRLAAAGITRGCNPPDNEEYCPDDILTRGQAAAFLVRALELPATAEDFFVDDEGSVFEGDINRLAAVGITRGCNPPANDEYCPGDHLPRDQFASFLARAFGLGG